jgi:DNA-binding transcriptional MocR family regulator
MRLVLLVLSMHMDPHGFAFPSISRLSTESGLSRRQVIRVIREAQHQGWLRKTQLRSSVNGYMRNEYQAELPWYLCDGGG